MALRNFFTRNLFPILLAVIAVVVALANYQPGTILSGWDTIHPEFNFPEYFKRVIYGAWQEHQGLGALASQGHASELSRLLIYFPLSFLLPDSILRYSYFFLTLIIGPLGIYYFLRKLLFKTEDLKSEIAAFSGGLFYLFNLAVVQHYYVPLEMFATHFASLPWLFLFAIRYLEDKKRSGLLIFSLATFFSSSIAHTSTLWFVYFGALLIFLISYSVITKKLEIFKRSLSLILLTILINAFWLGPNLYFVLESGQKVGDSKIHSLFSEEAFLQNKSFGTIKDLLIFKNFLFNWGEYIGDNQFGLLLDEWITHFNKPLVTQIGYLFSFIAIGGVVIALVKRKRVSIPIFLLFIISAFFWMNINPPLGFLFEFFQDKLPFFKEAFRFPFTKFSILLIFSMSIFFAFGISFISSWILKLKRGRIFIKIFFLVLLISFFYYMFPAFKGNLISPTMKVRIPQEYFTMFDHFKTEPPGRIAVLPVHSFWGWSYYSWGYQGAGFMWFGLKQPLLDREFDRWNPLNEQYYREMSYAIYTKDARLIEALIRKYDISYFILDKNILAAGFDQRSLFHNEITKLMEEDLKFKRQSFGDNIIVYNIGQEFKDSYLIENPTSVFPQADAIHEDFSYLKYKDYITLDKEEENDIFVPLRSLTNNHGKVMLPLMLSGGDLNLDINNPSGRIIRAPNISQLEETLSFDLIVRKTDSNVALGLHPKLPIGSSETLSPITSQINNKEDVIFSINKNFFSSQNLPQDTPLSLGKVSLDVSKDNFINVYESSSQYDIKSDLSEITYFLNPCQKAENPVFGITFLNENSFSIFGQNANLCFAFPLSEVLTNLQNSQDDQRTILISTVFNFEGPGAPNLCITPKNSTECFPSFVKELQQNGSLKTFSILHEVEARELLNLELKILLDTTLNPSKRTEVKYSSLTLGLFSNLNQITISKDVIGASVRDVSGVEGNRSLSIPFSGDENLSQDITKFPPTAGDCPSPNPRGAPQNKKNILKEEQGQFIRYISSEGSYCDHFSYDSLSPNQGYLLSVTSRNIEGLPVRMCVTNITTGRCDVFAHLAKSKEFIEEFFLVPPRGEGEEFDISINNFSIKGIPSINDVKSIHLIPFPYNFAYEIESVKENQDSLSTRSQIQEISKINPSFYLARLSDGSSGTIVLSQSFEKGWAAYYINNPIQRLLPILGERIDSHVLVNNWANGWQIKEDRKGDRIAIIYLPQYLEYFGLILLLSIFVYLIFGRKSAEKQNTLA